MGGRIFKSLIYPGLMGRHFFSKAHVYHFSPVINRKMYSIGNVLVIFITVRYRFYRHDPYIVCNAVNAITIITFSPYQASDTCSVRGIGGFKDVIPIRFTIVHIRIIAYNTGTGVKVGVKVVIYFCIIFGKVF